MDTRIKSLASAYDEKYQRGQYFSYREWLYRPFVRALARKANLKRGFRVLDVGCGQGFFSYLFADLGFEPLGVDISAEGIRSAAGDYGFCGAKFERGDVLSLEYAGEFDCVFARGLSLYNSNDFSRSHNITNALLKYLKPDGVMIFTYHTNLCPRRKSETWIYHSFSEVKKYFSSYPGATLYFTIRIETLLFGSLAFRFPFTLLCTLLSRSIGIGGELVAFVPRRSMPQQGGVLPASDVKGSSPLRNEI
jgi:SAM-dependent methyltransferase